MPMPLPELRCGFLASARKSDREVFTSITTVCTSSDARNPIASGISPSKPDLHSVSAILQPCPPLLFGLRSHFLARSQSSRCVGSVLISPGSDGVVADYGGPVLPVPARNCPKPLRFPARPPTPLLPSRQWP